MIELARRHARLPASAALLFGIAALALWLAAFWTTAHAQAWKAEWEKTVEAAKKEGNLVLNLLPNTTFRNVFLGEWGKEFPEIKVSVTSIYPAQFVVRVKTEAQAGKHLWDAVHTGPLGGFQLAKAGLMAPVRDEFIFPDLKDPKTWGGWDNAFLDEEAKYVLRTQWFVKMPFYNAKVLAPEKVERLGAKVMFEPEMKGKIVWQDPNAGGAGGSFGYALKQLVGMDGIKRLINDQQVVFVESAAQLVEKLVRGQAMVVMGPTVNSRLPNYEKAGLEFDIRGFGADPRMLAFESTGGFALYTFKQRPNPNAAKVFINWVLSKPIQEKLARALEQISNRTDVAATVPSYLQPKRGVTYLDTSSEPAQAKIAEVQKEIGKIRGM
jgi:iron(III) transport system substrate-binding protein